MPLPKHLRSYVRHFCALTLNRVDRLQIVWLWSSIAVLNKEIRTLCSSQ